MSIEAIGAVGATAGLLQANGVSPGAAVTNSPVAFSEMLDQVARLNQSMVDNETAIRSLAQNGAGNLHEIMMNLESARLQFDLLLQVRNKVLDAYQELMRMQI